MDKKDNFPSGEFKVVTLPRMTPGMKSAYIDAWLIGVGDEFYETDYLATVGTDEPNVINLSLSAEDSCAFFQELAAVSAILADLLVTSVEKKGDDADEIKIGDVIAIAWLPDNYDDRTDFDPAELARFKKNLSQHQSSKQDEVGSC